MVLGALAIVIAILIVLLSLIPVAVQVVTSMRNRGPEDDAADARD